MPVSTITSEQLTVYLSENGAHPGLNGVGDLDGAVSASSPPWTFTTDINSSGSFGKEWLVADKDSLYVFSQNGAKPELVRAIPMSDVIDARAEMYVGNGRIEVVTKAGTVPLVRFSQALISDANTLVRRINALAKG